MRIWNRITSVLAAPLAVLMLLASAPLVPAHAGLVSTEAVAGDSSSLTGERERLGVLLQRDDVRRQMEALGIDPDEAAARVAGMSDAQVAELAGQLDALPAGEGAAGVIIVAALVVAAVLFFTDLAGATDVYGPVNPAR